MTDSNSVKVCVIGAGPAGMAAAVEAGRCGANVTIIDSAPRLGGQFWRHGLDGPHASPDLHHQLDVFRRLDEAARELTAERRLTHLGSHQVWALSAMNAGCIVYATDTRDRGDLRPVVVKADRLVLAPGAYDRQVPFPGWDLPGVVSAGAAQALLKGHGVVVGPRVLVAGTGPFLLPVAAGLVARGARLVGVLEANSHSGWLRYPQTMISAGGKLEEVFRYRATLARHRVPMRSRSVVIAAHGTDQLEAVTVAKLDRAGKPLHAGTRRLSVDVLAVGWGFTAQTELLFAAGCDLDVASDGSPYAITDDRQSTSNPVVFAAGESTGIGGAQLAVAEGRIAGTAAACTDGVAYRRHDKRLTPERRTRARLRRFATAMHAVYPVPPAWIEALTPETIVCRCEEVVVADVDLAVELGARDSRSAKQLSRAGMGWCQGRICGYAVSCLVAARLGETPDLAAGSERAIATPVPLGLAINDM